MKFGKFGLGLSLMKRVIIFSLLFASISFSFAEQVKIPRNEAEDVDKIMSPKYWAVWNDEAQAKIDADIDKYRKADACVNIGKIKDGTDVVVEQISHDFKFGAHIFNFDQLGDDAINARYKAMYGALFNSATVAFYWYKFELEPNRPRFNSEYWDTKEYWNKSKDPTNEMHWRRPAPENAIKWCKQMGLRIHGHPLVWDHRIFHTPTWLLDKCLTDPKEREVFLRDIISAFPVHGNRCEYEAYTKKYKKLTGKDLSKMFPIFAKNYQDYLNNHVKRIAQYYGDTVDSWDVVNEAVSAYELGRFKDGDVLMKSRKDVIMPADYVYQAFQTAQKYFPASVKLNINDFIMKDEYRQLTTEMIDRGCKVDIQGAQMHLGGKGMLKVANGKLTERTTPDGVRAIMKRIYSGRPIHLSEITIGAPDTTYRGKMIQAIVARNMYRIWFSIEHMMGITWWNAVDGCGMAKEPTISGILTRSANPKPAYYALDELINKEWKTNFNAVPDADGNIKFRGFKGKYRFSWYDADGNEQFKIIEVK